ncbi:MAG: hypothetical protein L6461_06470 [Anaerolineae bacterium]|nr:hypothetical protein [Anaerolineae bacterium]
MNHPMPLSYHAFGLTIQSEIELTNLPAIDGPQENPVYIRVGQVPESLPDARTPNEYLQASGETLLLNLPGFGRMSIHAGQEVRLALETDVDPILVRAVAVNLGLSAILHQRGALALHASGVAAPGGAVLFCGNQRAGKSTLAVGLNQKGWPLLCDDKCAIIQQENQVLALPAFPQVKLWRDAIEQLSFRAEAREKLPEVEKYNLSLDSGFQKHPLPLRAIYLLHPTETENITFETLQGMAKFQAIKQYNYGNYYLKGLGLQAAHFHLISLIASRVPVIRIRRPRQVNQLEALIDKLDVIFRDTQ